MEEIKKLAEIVKNELVCMELQVNVMDEAEFKRRITSAKLATKQILELTKKLDLELND